MIDTFYVDINQKQTASSNNLYLRGDNWSFLPWQTHVSFGFCLNGTRSLELCMMITSIELYAFIAVSVTLTHFQGHTRVFISIFYFNSHFKCESAEDWFFSCSLKMSSNELWNIEFSESCASWTHTGGGGEGEVVVGGGLTHDCSCRPCVSQRVISGVKTKLTIECSPLCVCICICSAASFVILMRLPEHLWHDVEMDLTHLTVVWRACLLTRWCCVTKITGDSCGDWHSMMTLGSDYCDFVQRKTPLPPQPTSPSVPVEQWLTTVGLWRRWWQCVIGSVLCGSALVSRAVSTTVGLWRRWWQCVIGSHFCTLWVCTRITRCLPP